MINYPQKIGFLGGTFDPFHLGHLNLAIEVLEKTDLDEIWICPTNISPLKTQTPPIAIEHRIQMIELGISDISKLSLNEAEAFNQSPSYTYQTLKNICDTHQLEPHQLTLILADELLPSLHQWHEVNALLAEFPFLVATRPKCSDSQKKINPFVQEQIKNSYLPIRQMDISSCDIRNRLKNKLYCGHLLPPKILDYIYNYKLY